jgi:hemoglobin-like flavoprotein
MRKFFSALSHLNLSTGLEYCAAATVQSAIAIDKIPTMTEEQIVLVKNSWKTFRKVDSGLIGDVFYSKLFCDNPQLRSMFPSSMKQQYEKLIDMLSAIVARLDDLSEMTLDIKMMALRHESYGVKPQHYRLVGNALLWTIKRGLGNDWNNDLQEAWMAAYTKLSEAMIAAVRRGRGE